MFKFVERYEFDWPIVVHYPGQSGDVEAEFTARFVLLEEDELFSRVDLDDKAFGDVLDEERKRLSERWVGWSGIMTEGGTELPFSEDNRTKLLKQRPIREAVARAYTDAVIRGELAEKN